jgi:hypothetical protein
MEKEIIIEMTKLLEKSGLGAMTYYDLETTENTETALENLWINMKALNARYDKADALAQVQTLMSQYNIQIDELMERIHS